MESFSVSRLAAGLLLAFTFVALTPDVAVSQDWISPQNGLICDESDGNCGTGSNIHFNYLGEFPPSTQLQLYWDIPGKDHTWGPVLNCSNCESFSGNFYFATSGGDKGTYRFKFGVFNNGGWHESPQLSVVWQD